MPVYCYRRGAEVVEHFVHSWKDAPKALRMDHKVFRRSYGDERRQPVLQRANAWSKPVVSVAMGVHPSQVPEMERAFPGVKYTTNGDPVFVNEGQRRRYMKHFGFVDRDGNWSGRH